MATYKSILSKADKRFSKSVGRNMTNSQYALSLARDEERGENKAYEEFESFLNKLADDYGVEHYFEVRDGKITFY